MTNFSLKELQKIARLSAFTLDEQEAQVLAEQIQKTLVYMKELDQFNTTVEEEAPHNINVFREDKARQQDSAPLLAQAPKTNETYFSVPKILDRP